MIDLPFMAENRVVIAIFPQVIQAHIAKSRLEADGIEAFIRDENIVALNWLYSNAVGGVKLEVAAEDEKRARAILEPQKPDFSIPKK